ncbi:MAG: hypothetical protein OK456_03930 [Thaumarchaeota archaeon]|nr:hypothetical protein [Nitrososphaerota archaeon]
MYVQILVAISFIIAGYQDFRERLVSDLVWIPAVVGVVFGLYYLRSEFLVLIIPIALIGAIALGAAWWGMVGEADGIAFVLVIAGTAPAGFVPGLLEVFVVVLAALGIHVAYLYSKGLVGKTRVIPIAEFKAQAQWIPKALIIGGERTEVVKDVNVSREAVDEVKDESASVEVQYGVPTVAYIAAGYVGYIVILAILQPSALLSLP